MLIRNFYLKDIKEYEDATGNSILSFFDKVTFSNIIELIMLGNKCSETQACNILDDYMAEKEENTMVSAMLEIKEKLLGIGDNDDNTIDEKDKIDISKYNTLTDVYSEFGMELMSVGLSYSEFWSMSTKEMYRVFNSICIKMQNDTNRELNNFYILAAMVGASVWGKLQKEPPKVDIAKKKVDENSDVDPEVLMANAYAKSLVSIHNKRVRKE